MISNCNLENIKETSMKEARTKIQVEGAANSWAFGVWENTESTYSSSSEEKYRIKVCEQGFSGLIKCGSSC